MKKYFDDDTEFGDVTQFPKPTTNNLSEKLRGIIFTLSEFQLDFIDSYMEAEGKVLAFSDGHGHNISFIISGDDARTNEHKNCTSIWEISDPKLAQEIRQEGSIFNHPAMYSLTNRRQVTELGIVLRKFLKRQVIQEDIEEDSPGDISHLPRPNTEAWQYSNPDDVYRDSDAIDIAAELLFENEGMEAADLLTAIAEAMRTPEEVPLTPIILRALRATTIQISEMQHADNPQRTRKPSSDAELLSSLNYLFITIIKKLTREIR
jgi:hypothetical protein